MKLTAFLCFCFLIFFSGVIRHDVTESEYTKLANQPRFDCSGFFIHMPDSAIGGSCVLIGKNLVLTAAHCVFIVDSMISNTVVVDGIKMTSFTPYSYSKVDARNLEFDFKGRKVKGKKITVHPGYANGTGEYDLAIIELEESLEGISLPVLNRLKDELKSRVIGVGFGISGIASKPETVKPEYKKIAGENIIDQLTGFKTSATKEHAEMMADFDAPSGYKKCNKMGSAEPLPLEYIPQSGDSGSGLFRDKDGQQELVGICLGAGINIKQLMRTGYYGQLGKWIRVSVFYDWIEANMK